ncbi:uncharacterized protein TA07610 [Theileria annulata]|uniref:Uncharacterized protein n=1 Tax=Theileria annulata TaxID=5874 RepID=Q4UA28_THEAN|nr:uncharacterized protein TA07610 [Theileria annulata]CAI76325.1 hypothetical protein TA07610 [Theileria annulata]|eukprot:XP_952949.1 hypothetical protein TA07610 [Theileria annulata]
MFDYIKINSSFKVKSNLLIFVFLYFIFSTESVLLSKFNAKNENYSFNPTAIGSLFHRKQNKHQCFISNKIKRINNSCKTRDNFEDSNSPSIIQDNFILEAYGYTHDPNFNYTANFRNRYNNLNKTYTTPPAVFNNIPNNQYNPARNVPFNRINNQTYQQNGFNLYNRQLIPYPVVSNSYGNIPFGQNQMHFSQQQYPQQQYPQQLNRFPPQMPVQTVNPLQHQVPIPPTFQFRYQPPIQTINQVPFQQTAQQYSQVPLQQPAVENIKKDEPGKIVGSRYWQKRAEKFHSRSVRYSSFQLYEDVVWINNYEDDWPGINRIKLGEIYQGIIHYYFTPFDGLILLADKKVEGSMSMKDLPESFSKTTVRETFKLDHLISFKLKEPLEFDEKGRPKFVLALDYPPKTKKYEFRSRVRGRPIFVTNTMAVFKLEDGENYAQVFLANTGVHLTFPITIKMNEIFTKDEVVEMEVVRSPYYPKAVGYLCRIPFETPKGLELRSKYTMVDSVRYDGI